MKTVVENIVSQKTYPKISLEKIINIYVYIIQLHVLCNILYNACNLEVLLEMSGGLM